MGKTVKCNSRSSDSITKACYVITIVSLFQINKKVMLDSKYKERQKYTGSVLNERKAILCNSMLARALAIPISKGSSIVRSFAEVK